MAKRILLSALVNVLGDFVDGLTEENLAVGVWSGKIVLNHVQLNRKAIDKLNLSVSVEHGFIETLEVTIPWTGLESQPVKILINGVYLLVNAVDLSNLSQAEAFERNVASRVATLVQSEKSMELAMQMSLESENSDDSSYFQRLTSKIVDNLEVELRNVHLRYEDDITIPDSPFVCGLTLDSFTISTTDHNWMETFIARSSKNVIHKLAKVKNAGIYWNSMNPSESLSALPIDKWIVAMKGFIYTPKHPVPAGRCRYILEPPNTLTLKLLHNDTDGVVPKLVAEVDSSNLRLRLDKVQYHQSMRTKTRFEFLTKKQHLLQYRPVYTVRANPRAWWKYALILLTNRGDILTDKMTIAMTCCKYRAHYIDLLIASKLIDEETGQCYELSSSQLAEVAGIEEIVPLTALIVFRQLAAQEAFRMNQDRNYLAENLNDVKVESGDESQKADSWWSWGWLENSDDDDADEVDEKEKDKVKITDMADTLLHSSGHDSLSFTIDFKLMTKATLNLTSNFIPVATLDTGLKLTGSVRASSLEIMFAMTDILLIDNQTVNPIMSHIVSVCQIKSNNSRQKNIETGVNRVPFSVSFRSQVGKTTVKVSALPLEICLNKFCIQQLLSIFQVPDNEPPAVIDKQNRNFQNAFDLSIRNFNGTALTGNVGVNRHDDAIIPNKPSIVPDSMDIIIDIESPKIIIPEDSSRDIGCVVLDTGHLLVNGSLTASGMSWVVSIRAINADMPLRVQDIHSSVATKQYLIRPFGVDIVVQTINRSKADMTVEIEVSPNIRGEIDAMKLSRLMHTLEVISSTFSNDTDTSTAGRVGDEMSVTGLNSAKNLIQHGKEVDPDHVCLDISFSVQEVALTLQYGDKHSHVGVLSITRLGAHIQNRVYDSAMQFDLGALAIEDSMRMASQKYLVHTPPSDDGVLVKISYTVITSVKSPYFVANEKEVNVEFAKLNLHLDAMSLMFLRPFYEVILGKRLSVYPSETMSLSALADLQNKRKCTPSRDSVISVNSTGVLNSKPCIGETETAGCDSTKLVVDATGSMHVIVTLEVISLEVFRTPDISKEVSNGHLTVVECNQQKSLQSVAVLDICNLHADVTLTDIMEYDVGIKSVHIVDTRDVSREYKFKTLFCPDSRDFHNHSSWNEEQKSNSQNQIIIRCREDVEVDKSCATKIDIIVNDLTGYISLDTILDVVAVTLENTYAALDLVAPVPDGELEHVPSDNAQASAIELDQRPAVSMRVHVQVPNPRLFFLEDPTTQHSKAIVGRCSIDYNFSSEIINNRTVAMCQTMNLSLTDMELFVLFSMTKWNPRQIIDPMNISLFSKTCEESNIVTSCEYGLSIDSFNTRLSLSDIILAQSILLRRTLLESPPPATTHAALEDELTSFSSHNFADTPPTSTALTAVTAYTIVTTVKRASVVLINDFKGRNLPIVQGVLENFNFTADGVLQDLRGTGSFSLFAESFNGRVSEWETILDRWQPILNLSSSGTAALTFSLICNDTVQLSLTSTFLQTILQTQALLFMLNEGSAAGRGSVPAVVIKNQLGFPVQILMPDESRRGVLSSEKEKILFNLEADDEASIFTLNRSRENLQLSEEVVDRKGPLSLVFSSLPATVRLRFSSSNGVSFCSKMDSRSTFNPKGVKTTAVDSSEMPLLLNRPKKYQVIMTKSASSPERRNSCMLNSMPVDGKTVVDEVFENQRYIPISGSWSEPFMVNDPHLWTTRTGEKVVKEEIKLPSDEWEWQNDWKIDRWTYKIGVEIDDDGFEYALRFKSFVPGKPRMCSSLDCVRRRRWVRSRCLVVQEEAGSVKTTADGSTCSLNCFWDSHLLEDGSKEIVVRSNSQIHNMLPYDIIVRMHNSSWDHDYFEFGPVSANNVLAVPLLASDATSLQVKPAAVGKESSELFEWSQPIVCATQTLDYMNYQDLLCLQRSESSKSTIKTRNSFINNLPIRSKIVQKDSSIMVTLTGYLNITNILPCSMQYRCFNCFDIDNIEDTVICAEEGTLVAGDICKLTYVSLLYETFVTFKVGPHNWSPKIQLTKLVNNFQAAVAEDPSSQSETLQEFVEFPNDDGSTALLLRLEVHTDSFKGLTTLKVYSKNALIDRTGLGVSIRSSVKFTSKMSGQYIREKMVRSCGNGDSKALTLMQRQFHGADNNNDRENLFIALNDFSVKSDNKYKINLGGVNSTVHSDRTWTYAYLPPALCGQTYIATPCDDRAIRVDSGDFLQFRVDSSAVVLVLINKLVKKLPRWIRKGGFRRLVEQAISRGTHQGIEGEIHYNIYGKMYSPLALVELGSNFSKDAREMYTVFVVNIDRREGCDEMLEQINYNRFSCQREEAAEAWSVGKNGLSLFDCSNNRISVGTSDGVAWTSSDIKLNTLGTSAKGNFEICDRSAGKRFQLAYNVQTLSGIFDGTDVVTIMPQYCLVNCLDTPVEVRQCGSNSTQFVEPFASVGWHKEISKYNTTIQLRCSSSIWSFGALDVNEIGTSSLLLPAIQAKSSRVKHEPLVLNVEVKIADASEMCMVTITIWKSKSPENSPLSIRNESSIPITLCQSQVQHRTSDEGSNYELTVAANSWTSYGWTDPDSSKKILLAAGDSPLLQHNRAITMDVLRLNRKIRLPVGDCALRQQSKIPNKDLVKEVVLTVESNGNGVVLRIFEQKDYGEEDDIAKFKESQEFQAAQESNAFSFVFNVSSFGISIIADEPKRREILSLYTESMIGNFRVLGNTSSFEFSVRDMQIDNYCESYVYPVLFRRVHTAQPLRPDENETPFIHFVVIQETRPGPVPTVTCKYLSIRVLEFAVELDSGSIQIILSDFLQNLKLVSKDQALALQAPQEWMDDYNELLLSPESRLQLVDSYKAHLTVQQPKIVFENFIFHPLKISLTFVHTQLPRSRRRSSRSSISSAALNMLTSIVEVELMAIKLNSFIVSNAVESVGSMLSRIEGKVLQDLKGQLAQMAGSLTVLGSPVGLARNIGNGVEAFFYEPYQGLVLGPQDFVRGLGRGTSSLVAGFVTGTLTSTAALVSTASSGISYLSGDSEFVRDRTLRMQKLHASRSGAIEGLKGGGDLVVAGFANGISGIFSKPIEGAHAGGAHGFVKGLGLGVAGAFVKPTLGLADGFSSAAAGISNEVAFTVKVARARPARAFQRSHTDPSVRVLTPLDMTAIEAQEIVRTFTDTDKIQSEDVQEDEYIANYKMDNKVHVLLSELKLMLFHQDKLIRLHYWSEVSHCYFKPDHIGVVMYNTKLKTNPVKIYFKTRQRGVRLYKGLLLHSYLMGNPPGTLPLDRADELICTKDKVPLTSNPCSKDNGKGSIAGTLLNQNDLLPSTDYVFGSAIVNQEDLESCNEEQLIIKAGNRLAAATLGDESKGSSVDLNARIDETVTWLVHSYFLSCNKFSRSRCCVVVILNTTSQDVSVMNLELVKGRDLFTLDSSGYKTPSSTLNPNNGFGVFFGTGFPPSFYEPGVVELSLSTSTFEAVMSTDGNAVISERKGGDGRHVGFIEKTNKEWWSKYCILIT